jgi:hypothetical protein
MNAIEIIVIGVGGGVVAAVAVALIRAGIDWALYWMGR